MSIKPGDIVQHKDWQEAAKVIAVSHRSDGQMKAEFFLLDSKIPRTIVVSPDDLQVTPTILQTLKSEVLHPSNNFNLFVDAWRIRLAHEYDPFFSLSVTKIDALPHQIEAVYNILRKPQIRFLLADDAGLGKTITAGMLIKELKARRNIRRILLVVPPLFKTSGNERWRTNLTRSSYV